MSFRCGPVVVAILLLALLTLPTPAGAQRHFVGPVVAYEAADGTRIVVDDLGNGSTSAHPVRGTPVWSPDGNRVAAVDPDTGLVRVADVRDGSVIDLRQVEEVDGYFSGIDWFSSTEVAIPVGERLLAVRADGSGERLVLDNESPIFTIDVSPDGRMFVLGDCDELCSAWLWSTTGNRIMGLSEGATWGWSWDSQQLAYSGLGWGLHVLDVLTLESAQAYSADGFEDRIFTSVFTPDGQGVAFGQSGSGRMRTVAADGCCPPEAMAVGGVGHPRSFSPDGAFLAFDDFSSWTAAVSRIGHGPVPLPGGGGWFASFAPALPQSPASPPPASGPEVDEDPSGVRRFAGPTRIQTAVEASRHRWTANAESAVVVRADDFADALAATPLAAAAGGPLLLTYRDTLHEDTAAELSRVLAPGATVYVAGGEAVIGAQVVDSITSLGFVPVRLAGSGRAETSIEVAREAARLLPDGPSHVLLVEGGTFGDGLVGGNAAIRLNGVLVVGQRGAEHASTSWPDALRVVVGDWSPNVSWDQHVTGPDVFDLSAEMARTFPSAAGFALASGESFPDGLAGGAHAGSRVLLLTRRDELPASVAATLADAPGLWVYGGQAAVSTEVTRHACCSAK